MLVGKRIGGRYKIIDVIGGGGMSNVYLAHDVILDRDVAIKILHYNFSDEEDLQRRFQREALSATSLTHPNIVSIYDVGEDGDMHYLVMEYVKGQTLKQYIHDFAPLSPTKCVTIMKQLTSAIAHAHQNQIIHRDIKPQNILMDEEGNVKVTDFGISIALSATSYTQTNSVLGTVHYLSPEQARGGTATKKSDIYALGIVLYELLTGELPFSGESAISIALKHLQSETPSVRNIVPTIPQSLENVVLKATAKNPMHRYQSAEEMEADLTTVLLEERSHEPKFQPPVDHDATKALPIIREQRSTEADLQKTREIHIEQSIEEPSNSKQKKKKSKKNKVLIAVGTIISLLLLFIIVLFLSPDLFHGKQVKVPDVAGQELNQAVKIIEDVGFVVGYQTEQDSDTIKEGYVIDTSPTAGKEQKKGSSIDLIVSTGPKKVKFADYTGREVEQVITMLSKQDFKDIQTKKEYSSEPVGTIIKQQPEAGKEVIPTDTTIIFTVSTGPQEEVVSNLTGFDKAALDTYAKSSGFNIRITKEEYSDTTSKGQVISQSPKAGEKTTVGSTIQVVVSKGPQPKHAKMFIASIDIPYEPKVDGEEQQIRIYIQDRTRSIAEIDQEFKISSSMKKRISLEIEQGQKAIYRVVRDDQIIIDETKSYDDLN